MKTSIYITHTILIFFSIAIALCSCNNVTSEKTNEVKQESIEEMVTNNDKLLRHVVLFNFNDAATAETVKEIETQFAALPNQISEIHSFEWGINNSPEGLDKGLTHCFLVTFLSEKNREVYLPHPAHQKFVTFIGPYVEDVTVVDYWTE